MKSGQDNSLVIDQCLVSRTFAPRRARSKAISAPRPLDAPVTIATLPANVCEGVFEVSIFDQRYDDMCILNSHFIEMNNVIRAGKRYRNDVGKAKKGDIGVTFEIRYWGTP